LSPPAWACYYYSAGFSKQPTPFNAAAVEVHAEEAVVPEEAGAGVRDLEAVAGVRDLEVEAAVQDLRRGEWAVVHDLRWEEWAVRVIGRVQVHVRAQGRNHHLAMPVVPICRGISATVDPTTHGR